MTKVVINDERRDGKVKVGELSSGDCFVFMGELYMVTDECATANTREIICLEDGVLESFADTDYVKKVDNVTITIT